MMEHHDVIADLKAAHDSEEKIDSKWPCLNYGGSSSLTDACGSLSHQSTCPSQEADDSPCRREQVALPSISFEARAREA